jgi:hypothetical protein
VINELGQRQRCECHDCTQARAREHPFLPAKDWPVEFRKFSNPWNCSSPCCQHGYIGDCACTHGRTTAL